jgi:signal-transduction protein with cAMP-binding, CBS, and nucleotidyltransferase domain
MGVAGRTSVWRFPLSTVWDVLRHKGLTVHRISRKATVYEAIAAMSAEDIGALLVVDEGEPLNIVTERHYLREVALKGRSSKTTRVEEIMTPVIAIVDPTTPLDECMSLMTERRVRYLPVVSEGIIVGLVSIGDVIKHRLREQHAEMVSMVEYVRGRVHLASSHH